MVTPNILNSTGGPGNQYIPEENRHVFFLFTLLLEQLVIPAQSSFLYFWDPNYMPMAAVYSDEFSSWYFWRNQPFRCLCSQNFVYLQNWSIEKKKYIYIYDRPIKSLSKFGILILIPQKSPDFVPPSWGCRCFFARRCPMKKIITLVETKDAKLVTVSCLICFWWNGHVQFLYNSGAHYGYDVPFDFLICQTWTILNDWWLDNSWKISEMHFKSSLKAS